MVKIVYSFSRPHQKLGKTIRPRVKRRSNKIGRLKHRAKMARVGLALCPWLIPLRYSLRPSALPVFSCDSLILFATRPALCAPRLSTFLNHISINPRQVNLRFQDLIGGDLEDIPGKDHEVCSPADFYRTFYALLKSVMQLPK